MKIFLYTDNHYTAYSSIVRSRGKIYSTRLENQIETLNWVQRTAEEHKVNKIICLGDFFDKADLTSEEISALKEIKWSEIPNEFIVGNHEMGSSDLFFNSTNVLNSIGKVITKPELDIGFGYELLYLPYILEENRKTITSYKNELNTDMLTTMEVKKRYILSHNDIAGINYGGYTSKHGFTIEDIEKNSDLYINGHLHNQTWVTNKVLNLGNITGQNFSEDGFKYNHTAMVLDLSTGEYELIENPHAFNFYKIEINSKKDLEIIEKVKNNGYAIATIKSLESLSKEVKEVSDKIFKEYRHILTRETVAKQDGAVEIVNIDHLNKFREYILDNLGNSENILKELEIISK